MTSPFLEAISAVLAPEFNALVTAASMVAAASSRLKLYLSIMAADSMVAIGLAAFLPAMSGAEPCTGSNRPTGPPTDA